MNRVFVVAARRTPIGKTAGGLSKTGDVEMVSIAFRDVVARLGSDDIPIDGVYVGCCFPQEAYNLARKGLLGAGLSCAVPGATINRTCCSSMEALVQGARQIMVGDAQVILVGGVENMSRSPHVMRNAIRHARSSVGGKLPCFDEIKGIQIDDVGLSIELLVRRLGLSRSEQDQVAYISHRRAAAAAKNGSFKAEMLSVEIETETGKRLLDKDENVMEGITLQEMGEAAPVFISDGTVTKLNASSINDGAAAMVLMSEEAAKRYGLSPMVEYVCSTVIGVQPENTGIAPAEAIRMLLRRCGLTLEDIDLIECNEAYAAQLLACQRMLNWDTQKVNANGGSIALGHPLGCTGLRICVTLIHAMMRRGASRGLASMCAGGGMGQSTLFRREQGWRVYGD